MGRKIGITSEEFEWFSREFDEAVLPTLANSNVHFRPRGDTHVSDAHFEATENDRERGIVEFNTARIQRRQESVVIEHTADGLSPVEWEGLGMLVTDGGTESPIDTADQYDRHPDSVYRALGRIDDLVSRSYDNVELGASYVAESVHSSVQQGRDSVRRATEAAAKVLEAAERGLDARTSSFLALTEKYGGDVSERSDGITIRLGNADGDTPRKGDNEHYARLDL